MRILKILFLQLFFLLTACGGGGSSSSAGGSQGSSTSPTIVDYTIGGSLSGLATSGKVILNDNGADPLTLTADGTFTFATSIAAGGSYAATVATDPTEQTCTVSSGTGTSLAADISTIGVACATSAEKVLHSFAGAADGSGSYAGLVEGSDGNFYGTAVGGGSNGSGIVFKITASGTMTVLHNFGASGDGIYPYAALILASDGNFYGTTYLGGAHSHGTIYKMTPDGTLTVLYSFAGGTTDGEDPFGGVVEGSDGNFYGATNGGGSANDGVVFKMTPSGTETVLHSFTGGSDGDSPYCSLIQGTDGNFYGTTLTGGPANAGTVFKITPTGTETVLYAFTSGTDGLHPYAGLIEGADGNFYGTTAAGGLNSYGMVFKVTPAGVETIVYSFAAGTDGNYPEGGLIQDANGNIYGMTYSGGTTNFGTIFKITPTGTESILYSFAGAADGAHPEGTLIQGTDGHFYGVTSGGEVSTDYGTVLKY